MALTGLTPAPNKADTLRQLRGYVLAHCDADVQATFAPHGLTLEPLLCQLIRELKALQGGDVYADFLRTLTDALHALTAPAGGDPAVTPGHAAPSGPAESTPGATRPASERGA